MSAVEPVPVLFWKHSTEEDFPEEVVRVKAIFTK